MSTLNDLYKQKSEIEKKIKQAEEKLYSFKYVKLEIVLKSGYILQAEVNESDLDENRNDSAKLKEFVACQNLDDTLFIDLDEIALIRIMPEADKTEETEKTEKVKKRMKLGKDIPLIEACPVCNQLDGAYVYCDNEHHEYFCYCENCNIETKEAYRTKKAAIEAFKEGKVQACNN